MKTYICLVLVFMFTFYDYLNPSAIKEQPSINIIQKEDESKINNKEELIEVQETKEVEKERKEEPMKEEPIKEEVKTTQNKASTPEKKGDTQISKQPVQETKEAVEIKQSQPFEVPQEKSKPVHDQYDYLRKCLIELINTERTNPVKEYQPLYEPATLRAQEAAQKWSHTRPNGTRWNTTLENIINIKTVPHGENLGQLYISYCDSYSEEELSDIAKELHQALVKSPSHYKAMTNENYKKVNIGIYTYRDKNILTITIAQHFIQ